MDAPASKFYEDPEVDEIDEIESFLKEISDGRVRAQHEGIYGMPERGLKLFMKWLPWSAFAGVIGLAFLYMFLKLLCCDDDYSEAETVNDKGVAQAKKVD